MWMRFEATTRRPASSSILVTAPVRFRRVASGLMIEKVRVTAMTGRSPVYGEEWIGAPPSREAQRPQPSGLLLPAAVDLRPVAAFNALSPSQQLPGEPRPVE